MLAPVEVADPSDRELLADMARGDRAAFGALYDRYASLALGLATRIVGDRGTAEEVVQDAFLSAWRRAGTYQPERGEPRAWLLSIVHHRAIDRVRGPAARARHERIDDTPAAEPVDPVDVWGETLASLTRQQIAAALRELPTDQRQTIELAFFGGLTHLEIAERLDLPLGTVKGRVRLGLRRLRILLERHEEAAARQPAAAPRRRSGLLPSLVPSFGSPSLSPSLTPSLRPAFVGAT
jgi:RNA polymerase sigma-70 factor (ECF subfamily)